MFLWQFLFTTSLILFPVIFGLFWTFCNSSAPLHCKTGEISWLELLFRGRSLCNCTKPCARVLVTDSPSAIAAALILPRKPALTFPRIPSSFLLWGFQRPSELFLDLASCFATEYLYLTWFTCSHLANSKSSTEEPTSFCVLLVLVVIPNIRSSASVSSPPYFSEIWARS